MQGMVCDLSDAELECSFQNRIKPDQPFTFPSGRGRKTHSSQGNHTSSRRTNCPSLYTAQGRPTIVLPTKGVF